MTTQKNTVKQAICEAIDRNADRIIGLGERIRKHPELGFKEFKTARLAEETFSELGLKPRSGLAVTGVRAEASGARPGPTFALLGELDGLVVAGHPVADPETGAAHACGHNAQMAGLLGAAMGLLEARAFDHLAGRVVFFAVPAEEYGDVEWRVEQSRAGRIEFLGGKPELLRLGHFDDVDLAMMIHTTSQPEMKKAGVSASNNGCIVKTVRYVGRASHAGGAPHLGINALYAANIGLSAINALRETFRDEDSIRVHPIITHGGSQVNVIPGEVRIETYVRGKTVEAILDANRRVDRALKAGALALGARVEIETLPGYLPLFNHMGMAQQFKVNAGALLGADQVTESGHRSGSTDMGDISHVMPTLHPYMGGATGSGHGADYTIADPKLAYLEPAKQLALMAVDLLWDDAAGARKVAEEIVSANGAGRALGLGMDVTGEASVRAAFEEAVLAYGGVDIVVSNAGTAHSAPVDRMELADWERSFAVNATGHFLVAREGMRILKTQGLGGAFVFVATKNVMSPGKDFSAYSASKAAEAQLAKVLSLEGGPHGIRSNIVNPDAVFRDSKLWSDDVRRERARAQGITVDELEDFYRKRNILARPILPEDVAEAVLFLASDRSAKTTGCTITVDGGVKDAFPR